MSENDEIDKLAYKIYSKKLKNRGVDINEIVSYRLFKAAHDCSISENINSYYDIALRILKIRNIKDKLSNNEF